MSGRGEIDNEKRIRRIKEKEKGKKALEMCDSLNWNINLGFYRNFAQRLFDDISFIFVST